MVELKLQDLKQCPDNRFDLISNPDQEPADYCIKCAYRDILAPLNSPRMCCYPKIPNSSAGRYHELLESKKVY